MKNYIHSNYYTNILLIFPQSSLKFSRTTLNQSLLYAKHHKITSLIIRETDHITAPLRSTSQVLLLFLLLAVLAAELTQLNMLKLEEQLMRLEWLSWGWELKRNMLKLEEQLTRLE